MEVVGGEDVAMRDPELDKGPGTVDPSVIVLGTDTLTQPSSSLFKDVDESTLPRSHFLAGIDMGLDDSSHSTTTASSSSGDESSIPYDTFDTTAPERNTIVQVVIPPQPKLDALPYSSNQSGLVYDARMRFHAEIVGYDEKDNDFHPEDPRRIHEIFQELSKAGLVVNPLEDATPEDAFKLWRVPIRPATAAEIYLVHTPEHYEWVKSLAGKFASSSPPTPTN